MIVTDLVRIYAVGSPAEFSRPMERAQAQQWLDQISGRGPVAYELTEAITCACCGEPATYWMRRDDPQNARCRKHVDRNPCLVEGCTRTGKADGQLANDQLICGTHWREFVPVGSPQRRIYNRFFRRAKKYGWNDQSKRAFWRFWRALVSHVRAKARGDVDMDEVNRLMGWS